jgi:hypothetical protein
MFSNEVKGDGSMKKVTSRILLLIPLLIVFTGCGNQNAVLPPNNQSAVSPLDIPEEVVSTDIQTRLVNATGIEWEDGRTDGSEPYGFIQRIIPTNVYECDIDVFVFRTDELAKKAKSEVTRWGWSDIWQFEDSSTKYGIFLGERSEGQPCTDDAASTFNMTLTH